MEVIGTFGSLVAARKLLDQLAVEGGWKATDTSGLSVVYTKGGEQMLIQNPIGRKFIVVKANKEEIIGTAST